MTCQRDYSFDLAAYKSFFEIDLQTTKTQQDKEVRLQAVLQFVRLETKLFAQFAAAFVDGIDAQTEQVAHFSVGEAAARKQTHLGVGFV